MIISDVRVEEVALPLGPRTGHSQARRHVLTTRFLSSPMIGSMMSQTSNFGPSLMYAVWEAWRAASDCPGYCETTLRVSRRGVTIDYPVIGNHR